MLFANNNNIMLNDLLHAYKLKAQSDFVTFYIITYHAGSAKN